MLDNIVISYQLNSFIYLNEAGKRLNMLEKS